MKTRSVSRLILVVIVIAIIVGAVAAYTLIMGNQNTGSQGSGSTKIRISGAGATFIAPFLQTAAYEYALKYPVEVDYASIGSGGGIKQFLEKTIDFGASDAPLPYDKWLEAGDALHIPAVIGAVVIIYNIPDLPSGKRLKFTGQIIADMYLGKINKWNDPAIVALNPELANVDKSITVVHRSDGSGTTYVFTQYLSVVSEEWAQKVGYSTSVNWPAPNKLGGKGNEGVAGTVKNTPYSLGYVEFTYAIKNNISYGYLDNPSTGEFVEPSLESIAKTAEYITITLPKGHEDWSKVSIINSFFELSKTNKNLKGAYPVVSFSYILVYKELSKVPGMTKEKAKALVEFLKWLVTEGQQYAEPLHYVPIPQPVRQLNLNTISLITYNGQQP
jgi:phosphate ABC transporter, phosphate-binding protein